jgi:hypothetical protein
MYRLRAASCAGYMDRTGCVVSQILERRPRDGREALLTTRHDDTRPTSAAIHLLYLSLTRCMILVTGRSSCVLRQPRVGCMSYNRSYRQKMHREYLLCLVIIARRVLTSESTCCLEARRLQSHMTWTPHPYKGLYAASC